MPEAYVSDDLVHSAHGPGAVKLARGVEAPEACLRDGETVLRPAAGRPARLVLDFGEERVGQIELQGCAEGETTVELVPGEDLEEATLPADPFPPDFWYRQPRPRFTWPAGVLPGRVPGRHAFRYLQVIVHGPGVVRLRRAVLHQEHAPAEDRGWFSCSDPLLNEAWAISRRTVRLCRQAFYEDGIKRDAMLWIGDLRAAFLCSYPLFGDATVARRSYEVIARCARSDGSLPANALHAGGHAYPRVTCLGDLREPGGLGEWTLANYVVDFVAGLREYELLTGDGALLRELEAVWRGALRWLDTVDPREAAPHGTFITDNQPESVDYWWGSRSALAWQLVGGFNAGAELARLVGDAALAGQCLDIAARRRREALGWFGNPAAGAMRDDVSGESTQSWHAYAAAHQAGGLASGDLRAVFRRLATDPSVRRPMAGFMELYLLQAWMEAGLTREALDEMRSYWGQMLRSGATTTWEVVDRREVGIDHIKPAGRSHCHVWSAGPAYLLPTGVLGVRPVASGWSQVVVRPNLGGLNWAEGTVPTPHGDIRVSLEATGGGEVHLPAGVSGRLELPGQTPREIRGAWAWGGKTRDHGLRAT
jgi:alpha-L-rhamnosidase